MNKKNIVFMVSIIILIIVILAIIVTYIINNKQKSNNIIQNENTDNTIQNTIINPEKEIEIRSENNNSITYEDIEVEDIKIQYIDTTLYVKTRLKNNSNEDINGFYFEMELLDKNGNMTTTIAENSIKTIKAGATLELESNVVEEKKPKDVVSAKITYFDKGKTSEQLEDKFNEMTPQLP